MKALLFLIFAFLASCVRAATRVYNVRWTNTSVPGLNATQRFLFTTLAPDVTPIATAFNASATSQMVILSMGVRGTPSFRLALTAAAANTATASYYDLQFSLANDTSSAAVCRIGSACVNATLTTGVQPTNNSQLFVANHTSFINNTTYLYLWMHYGTRRVVVGRGVLPSQEMWALLSNDVGTPLRPSAGLSTEMLFSFQDSGAAFIPVADIGFSSSSDTGNVTYEALTLVKNARNIYTDSISLLTPGSTVSAGAAVTMNSFNYSAVLPSTWNAASSYQMLNLVLGPSTFISTENQTLIQDMTSIVKDFRTYDSFVIIDEPGDYFFFFNNDDAGDMSISRTNPNPDWSTSENCVSWWYRWRNTYNPSHSSLCSMAALSCIDRVATSLPATTITEIMNSIYNPIIVWFVGDDVRVGGIPPTANNAGRVRMPAGIFPIRARAVNMASIGIAAAYFAKPNENILNLIPATLYVRPGNSSNRAGNIMAGYIFPTVSDWIGYANEPFIFSLSIWSTSGDFSIVLVDRITPRIVSMDPASFYEIRTTADGNITLSSCTMSGGTNPVTSCGAAPLGRATNFTIGQNASRASSIWFYYDGNGYLAVGSGASPSANATLLLSNGTESSTPTQGIFFSVRDRAAPITLIQSLGFSAPFSVGGASALTFGRPIINRVIPAPAASTTTSATPSTTTPVATSADTSVASAVVSLTTTTAVDSSSSSTESTIEETMSASDPTVGQSASGTSDFMIIGAAAGGSGALVIGAIAVFAALNRRSKNQGVRHGEFPISPLGHPAYSMMRPPPFSSLASFTSNPQTMTFSSMPSTMTMEIPMASGMTTTMSGYGTVGRSMTTGITVVPMGNTTMAPRIDGAATTMAPTVAATMAEDLEP